MPGDGFFDTAGETSHKIPFPASRIKIVKYIRAVLFDLRAQDFAQRRTRAQAMLARPNSLYVRVIAIGEKRPFGSLIDRQKDMRYQLAKIQKCVNLAGKRRMVLDQFTNFWPQ